MKLKAELFGAIVGFLAVSVLMLTLLGWGVMLIVSPFHSMPWRDAIRIAFGVIVASIVLRGGSKRG